MASKMHMEEPICLIVNNADSQLEVKPQALEILKGITEPLVVVAIVGIYRTGKSYLMNRLAGKMKGFPLGSTIQSVTKGIWMWCVPHPKKPNHTLLLLDTEGLGDVEKGSPKNDSWIFALSVLLSSTFVYNSMGTIDEYAMQRLHFVTELTDLIKVKAKGKASKEDDDIEEDDQFVRFFPNFIWVVRDFILELKTDKQEQELTDREYLEEHALPLKKGLSKAVRDYNLPRECIKTFFPTRTCFTFIRPASEGDINRMESLPESALAPKFIEKSKEFCEHIFQTAQVKTVKGGHPINGRMFASLVQSYVDTILSGAVPCLENAVLSMATIENQAAVREGAEHYTSRMKELVQFPAELQELSKLHGKCEAEALEIFMRRSFKDEEGKYQKELTVEVAKRYTANQAMNEKSSFDKCRTLLRDLSATLEKNLKDGVYAQPGGYEKYVHDRDEVVNQFQKTPGKGVKAQEALDEFLTSKRGEADAILKADKYLTEAQKKLAVEKERAAQMEQEKKAAEEKSGQKDQAMKDQERSHQQNMKQLKAKMEEEAANNKKEAEKALESKLKLHQEMLEKGFKEKARMMEEEIAKLKKEASETQKKDNAAGIVESIMGGILKITKAAGKNKPQGQVYDPICYYEDC